MAQRRLGQHDAYTREVLSEGFVAYVAPKRKNGFGTKWLAMAQDAIQKLAKHRRELGEEGFAVLLSMIARVDYENVFQAISHSELAAELDMQRSNVSRAVKRLVDLGVFLMGPKIGRNNTYRLNPEFGWKGSAQAHVVALDQVRKQRMEAARIEGVVTGGQWDDKTGDLFD